MARRVTAVLAVALLAGEGVAKARPSACEAACFDEAYAEYNRCVEKRPWEMEDCDKRSKVQAKKCARACAPRASKPVVGAKVEPTKLRWRKYRCTDFGVRFELPRDWLVMDGCSITHPKDEEFEIRFDEVLGEMLATGRGFRRLTPEQFPAVYKALPEWARELSPAWFVGRWRVERREQTVLNGLRAASALLASEGDEDVPAFARVNVIVTPKRQLRFMSFIARASDYRKYAPIVERIFGSVEPLQ